MRWLPSDVCRAAMPAMLAALLLSACATPPSPSQVERATAERIAPPMPSAPATIPRAPAFPAIPPPPPVSGIPTGPSTTVAPAPRAAATAARYERVDWRELPEWDEPQFDAWQAWLKTCAAVRASNAGLPGGSAAGASATTAIGFNNSAAGNAGAGNSAAPGGVGNPIGALPASPVSPATAAAPLLRRPCAGISGISPADPVAQQEYFERHFTPYRLVNSDGTATGLVTGYYEPLLMGSRRKSARFRYPLYAPPPDLVALDAPEGGAEGGRRMRGRMVPTPQGDRMVPYFARADIVNGTAPVRGLEIAWVEDPVELFFLQIQGSGRIRLPDGAMMRVGFADHNGHPYRSIGRWLIDAGELPADQASMQGIKAWVRRNPDRLDELLNQNPAYVFFRELPAGSPEAGPPGSLGVPLTAGRSIAVDPRSIPLGLPVFVATTWPLSNEPLARLTIAQDTGSAIRGVVRADLFWGFGPDAAEQAGRMKQSARMWMLWPNGEPLPTEY